MNNKKLVTLAIVLILIFNQKIICWTTGVFSDPQFLKGIVFADWTTNGFKSANAWNSLSKLHETGATWVSIVPTWYMDNSSSTLIYLHPSKSASDDALKQVIDWAHNLGLKVMLKPHIDVLDGTWRGAINPSSWSTWFDISGTMGQTSGGYKNFILHYAQIAQEKGVEMFCIGTELRTSTTNSGNNSMWQNVITSIKNIYTGPLTYAANGSNYYESDEFLNTNLDSVIWPNVDILGVDVYFPLTNSIEPSIDALYNAWSNNKDGKNLIQLLLNLKNKYPAKKLIFTEIGYRSYGGSNIQPFDLGTHTNYSGLEQQYCYEAAFRKLSEQNFWHGAFWWDWEVDPDGGGAGNTWYVPQNKPAEQILKNWYGATPVPTVTPSPTTYIPDTALYHYEGGDLMNWVKETTIGPQTQSIVNTTLYSYRGDHSVAMDVTFSAGTFQKGAMMIPGISPSNGIAKAYILAPLYAPETIAKFFINDANWDYFESPFISLIPGVWTELTWNITGIGTTIITPLQRFGIIVQSAGDYKAYDGYYYIDSIDVPGVQPPTPTPTTNPTDPTLYPFEDGTIMGWNTYGDQITGSSNSTVQAYLGVRSLAVSCNFTGATGGNVGTTTPIITDLRGKTIVAHVFVPADFPEFGGGYIYIKSGAGWVWENGPWTNFTPGTWNTIYLDVDQPAWSAPGTPDHSNIKELGVKISPPGSFIGSWTGTCYIDSVDVFSGAGTPTNTPTRTNTQLNTNTPTRTATYTSTSTSTFTFTNTSTGTNTSTLTYTSTPTETQTGTQAATLTWTATMTNTNTGVPTNTSTSTSTNTFTMTNTATATNTATPAGGIDNSLYPFEDGTRMGWEVFGDQIISSAYDNTQHYLGTGSLRVSCAFTTDAGGNVGTQEPLITNLQGAILKARVYVPIGFPTGGGGYIYIKSGAWVWQNGGWVNFTPGAWTEITFDLANPAYTAPGTPDHTNIREIGIKIAPAGGWTGSYNGDVNIDTVEVLGILPTPTPGIDTATYPFEDGTDMGWNIVGEEIVSTGNTGEKYYLGIKGLKVNCNFTTSTGGTVGTQNIPVSDLRGVTITGHVWIPWDLPRYSGGYIYIKSGELWTWEQGTWKNLDRGRWNEISYYVNATEAAHAEVKEIGIKIAPAGGWTGTFNKAVYIDSVNLHGLIVSTPTYTSTFTPTFTPTYTETFTTTGTQQSTFTHTTTLIYTNTNTFTVTSTHTNTIVFSLTPTNTMISTQTQTPTEAAELKFIETQKIISYPNPFNAKEDLSIKFSLSKKANNYTFNLYTVAGRLIKSVSKNYQLSAGENQITIGKDKFLNLSKGVYFYFIIVKDDKAKEARSGIKKLVVIQ